jgi:hypothetical protein
MYNVNVCVSIRFMQINKYYPFTISSVENIIKKNISADGKCEKTIIAGFKIHYRTRLAGGIDTHIIYSLKYYIYIIFSI